MIARTLTEARAAVALEEAALASANASYQDAQMMDRGSFAPMAQARREMGEAEERLSLASSRLLRLEEAARAAGRCVQCDHAMAPAWLGPACAGDRCLCAACGGDRAWLATVTRTPAQWFALESLARGRAPEAKSLPALEELGLVARAPAASLSPWPDGKGTPSLTPAGVAAIGVTPRRVALSAKERATLERIRSGSTPAMSKAAGEPMIAARVVQWTGAAGGFVALTDLGRALLPERS